MEFGDYISHRERADHNYHILKYAQNVSHVREFHIRHFKHKKTFCRSSILPAKNLGSNPGLRFKYLLIYRISPCDQVVDQIMGSSDRQAACCGRIILDGGIPAHYITYSTVRHIESKGAGSASSEIHALHVMG